MRRARRVWACAATCVLVIVLCVGAMVGMRGEASAQGGSPSYTIKVTGTKAHGTYTAYKVFDVVYQGDNYAYTISNSNPFYQAVSNSGLFKLEQIENNGTNATFSAVLKEPKPTDLSSLAAALRTAYDGMTPKPTAAATATATTDDQELTLAVSAPGYYFVNTTTGTICSLDTTNPNAAVVDKNANPGIQKLVQEPGVNNGDYGYVAQNDAAIGDTVNFRTKITVTQGAENFKVHDTLPSGLTLNADSFKFGITPNPDEAVTKENFPTGYENGVTITTTGLTDGCTFEVGLSNELHTAFLNEGGEERQSRDFYVFYSATLNSNAVVGSTGNPNTTKLVYGENNDLETEPAVTKTYTWPLEVVKYTGNDSSTASNRLAGAKFTLTKANATTWAPEGSALAFAKDASSNVYTKSASGPSEITTDGSGTFRFSGLDSGTYLLTETAAPDGYNKIAEPIKVTVGIQYDMTAMTMNPTYQVSSTSGGTNSNSGTVALGTADATKGTVFVQNNTGRELPSAGGMGTTVMYVVGGVLVVGATAALVAKRRNRKA